MSIITCFHGAIRNILHKNIMLWYSLKTPHRDASNEYHSICFQRENK